MAVGGGLVLFGAFLPWVEGPFRGDLSFGWFGGWFGWMALLTGGIAGIAWFLRSNRLLAVCGMAGVGLCALALFYLAFRDPSFGSLVDENTQYTGITRFSRRYLPANRGIEPSFKANLFTETLFDRLTTAVYFMSRGWWFCLVGGGLLLVGAMKGDGKGILRWTAVGVSAALLGPSLMLLSGLAAEIQQARGDRQMASGRYVEAIQYYESARRWDPQWTGSEGFYARMGEASIRLGFSSDPNGRFYQGRRYEKEGRHDAALSEYFLAMKEVSSPLTGLIQKRIASIYVALGQASYRKRNVGEAVRHWERALSFDPTQIQVAYFLNRAYFDQGRYEQGIAMGRFLLSQSKNLSLNANVQANIGDGYWKLNDFARARVAYEASRSLDSQGNFRIFKSLGGT